MTQASVSGRYPLKQAIIDESTIATNEIVAAVAGKQIRVISLMFTVAGAVNLTWEDDTADITGIMEFADSGGLTHASDSGIFWTRAGEALNLTADAAVAVGGVLTYIEV